MILPGTGRGTAEGGGGGMRRILRPEVVLTRALRRSMRYPEVLLGRRLRGGATGLRFLRRHPVGPYVADFHRPVARLAIAVDGEIHAQPAAQRHDRSRNRVLEDDGSRVMRITAADMVRNTDSVAAATASLVATPLHHPADGPPPRSGEDQE